MIATLFDFNGVLVDDEHVHLAAFRDVLTPLDVRVTDEDYAARYLGFDDVGAFRAILKDAGKKHDDATVRALVEAKKPAYMARAEKELRIFEGAVELIARRSKAGIVGIVSGALKDEIHFALERMGVAGMVAFIIPAEQCRNCKPDPEGYLLAIEHLGGAREGAVVIEDSIAGVQAAKSAGLRCVAVTHSYAAAELTLAGADAVTSTLADLTDALLDGVS